jgi:hypothetical protein
MPSNYLKAPFNINSLSLKIEVSKMNEGVAKEFLSLRKMEVERRVDSFLTAGTETATLLNLRVLICSRLKSEAVDSQEY